MSARIGQHVVLALVGGTSGTDFRVTEHVTLALIPIITRSPTTPTGAGFTQHVTLALLANDDATVRITSHVVLALVAPGLEIGSGGGGFSTPSSFGYSV